MPEISKFYGIRIEMFFNDHNPPHFHVKYGQYKAEMDIRTLGILKGWLPPKAQSPPIGSLRASTKRLTVSNRWNNR
jgi:hypothetical protein